MISLPSLNEVKQQTLKTGMRFPLPTLCAFILTGLGLYITHNDYGNTLPDWIWQGLITAMLGLISLTALTLVAETISKKGRGYLMLAGVLLLGLYFWSLPSDPNTQGSLWVVRHIFLILGSFIALSWSPFWKQGVSNKILWLWSSQIIGSLVVTLFFALVLFLGLAAAVWSTEMLFDLDFDENLYLDIWITIAALFSPLFFLSQFISTPEKLKEPKSVSGFMGVFTKYIMTPIAVIYMVILYAYTAKILITWEWPKNVLGWLVIVFLGVAIFTYFLWTPLLKPSWDKYRRLFWLSLLPQIFLLFIAIGWRISAYSWTENRYFVVILGLWLLGTTLYFLIRKNAQFKWVFVALTAIIGVSQIGPLSGYNIGKTAQLNRLDNLLIEAGVSKSEKLQSVNIDVNDNTENEIASILDYLEDRFGPELLKARFSELDYTGVNRYNFPDFIMEGYGLEYRSKWDRNNENYSDKNYRSFNTNMTRPLAISGFDWKVSTTQYTNANAENEINGYRFQTSRNNETATIKIYKTLELIETIDVSKKLESLLQNETNVARESVNPEEAFIMYDSERFKAKIYLTRGYQYESDAIDFGAEIFLSLKD